MYRDHGEYILTWLETGEVREWMDVPLQLSGRGLNVAQANIISNCGNHPQLLIFMDRSSLLVYYKNGHLLSCFFTLISSVNRLVVVIDHFDIFQRIHHHSTRHSTNLHHYYQ
jgi:hypothetical protein